MKMNKYQKNVIVSEERIQQFAVRVYPNPFTTTMQADYNLQHSGKVNLTIYDNIGEQVKVLLNEYQQQGEQQVIFNTKVLPAGIYFCVLKTNYDIQTKKLIKH